MIHSPRDPDHSMEITIPPGGWPPVRLAPEPEPNGRWWRIVRFLVRLVRRLLRRDRPAREGKPPAGA